MGKEVLLRDTFVFDTSAMQAGVPGTNSWRRRYRIENGLKKRKISKNYLEILKEYHPLSGYNRCLALHLLIEVLAS